MANCTDCFRNCDQIPPDRCVEYTGPDIDCLGICNGDTLYEVEAQIAEKLCAAMDGTGIDLSEVDISCEFLTDILGDDDPTLLNLMQMLVTASCTLKEFIDAINEQLNDTYVFNTACLEGILTNRDDILQAVILKLCDVETRLEVIEADYVTNANLCTLVQACIDGSGGPPIPVQYSTRMVPYAPIPYEGPLSNFSNTGIGVSALGFEKIYLCNGLNGTRDWRGRSPIGAINNVPGGVLDAAVDPSLPANAGLNYNLHQKVGASSVTLGLTQVPAHSHVINDPGHVHSTTMLSESRPCGAACADVVRAGGSIPTTRSTTGITIGSSGGGQSHTNLSPMIACYYIIYIP